MPAVSWTAKEASATVRFVAEAVRAVVRVSVTLVPVTLAAVVVTVTPLAWMVMLVRRTALRRVSLNVRITCVPSVDVVGASLPVVTSVGRMPSTLWSSSIATAAWSRSAVAVVLPVAVMAPPVSVFAAIATPFWAESPSTTLYSHTIVVVFVAAVQPAAFAVPSKSSSSCGVPVMSTAASKVTVAWTNSLMP